MPSKEYEDILELLDSMPDTTGLSFVERRANFEDQVALLPVAENVTCEPLRLSKKLHSLYGKAWQIRSEQFQFN